MGSYNEELVKAGVMLAGEGLHPSQRGCDAFFGHEPYRDRRPLHETKELIAGFWLWQVASMEEAIAWLKKCPNPMTRSIRRRDSPFEADDFGAEFTPELRAQKPVAGAD